MNIREICLPLTGFSSDEPADIVIKNRNQDKELKFRIEVFKFGKNLPLNSPEENNNQRILKLREYLSDYSKEWELIQLLSDGNKEKVYTVFKLKNL